MPVNSKLSLQPLDRVAIALMLVLSLLIGLLLWQGDAIAPRVRDFSWQEQQIGAEDTAFSLTFSRPMDTNSVEANLQIDPPLPGKISWAGRRMSYTLLSPPPYGNSYQVQLQLARDRFAAVEDVGKQIQPFQGNFQTRDRALVYLGVEGEEQGRLILYNFTQQQKTILTPQNLVVVDFKPYPTGDRVLFAATERQSDRQNPGSSQLYTVTTGLHPKKPEAWQQFWAQGAAKVAPVGRIDLVLDSRDYQNLKFDLSPDGQMIVVQRVNQRNPGEFGLWVIRPDSQPQPLKAQPGGDFLITPDSTAVAVAQGEGIALLPLQTATTEPLEPLNFLPQFGVVLDFARDGSQSAMVRFNSDYTRSLFLVTNQGEQQQLLRTDGSILSAAFDPSNQTLYCLLTQLLPGEAYEEQPYLAAIDLQTGKQTPIVVLPNQRDVRMSLSPDGLGLLFDQIVTATTPEPSATAVPRTTEGAAIATSRLWLLPLPNAMAPVKATALQPEQLPLPGFYPRWLP